MFSIPKSFSSESEAYITIPPMKQFISEHQIVDAISTLDRSELLEAIIQFGQESKENEECVLSWLDSTLKEGTKDIFIYVLDDEADVLQLFCDDQAVKAALDPLLGNPNRQHLVGFQYSAKLKLFRYSIQITDRGRVISLAFGALLSGFDRIIGSRIVTYPIFIDIYVDKKVIIGRAKPKAGLYEYMDPFSLENANTTNPHKQIEKAIRFLEDQLDIEFQFNADSKLDFKKHLYALLKMFTETPASIIEIMNAKKSMIDEVIKQMHDDICSLPSGYKRDLKTDIYNLVEKYLSISTADKSIFIKDREAYPLKISATDDEDSKVEQTSALEQPLQSKAIFFDNKKMMQLSECCDGIVFMFQRLNSQYHARKDFPVKISAMKNECYIKLTQYTSEEDILHAIFLLIEA